MGETEAKVRFGETGSQQVVQGFKSVGQAAGGATTNITSAGNAIKNVGSGMKNVVSSIGQVAGAFATLSLSIVNTYRSYRDLEDTQIAVNTSNIKLTNSIQKLNDLKAKAAILQKQGARGSLEEKGKMLDVAVAHDKVTKAIKDHGKKSLEAAVAQQKYKEAVAASKGPNTEYLKAQREIADQEEIVANNKLKLGEAIERQNDAQQNFYLSLLPTVLSSVGTIATVTSAAKSAIGTGTTGLIGSLGGIGLVLGGLSLAVVAYQNNWLGFKDVVGGVIDWVKDRLDLWKQGFADVFEFIKKGDWAGAFNRIKEGAAKFWEDLKKSNPFFGGVATLVEQIRAGKWGDAFNTIKSAAITFWTQLKAAVPFFGTIETVITQIKNGKWQDAFKTIADSILKGLQSILGADLAEKIVLKFQLMKDSAYAELNLMKDAFTKKGGPIDLINQGLAKLGAGDIVGGFTQIWLGFDKAVAVLNKRISDWLKLNFGFDLEQVEKQANAIGVKILDGIKGGLTFVARTWIDPVLTKLLDPQTWIQGFIAMGGFFVRIGTALWTAITTSLTNAAKDPKGVTTWWSDLGNAIWKGISDWFSTNLPDTTEAMKKLAAQLQLGIETAKADFENLGIAMWNAMIEGIRSFTGGGASPFGGALDALKKEPVKIPTMLDFQAGGSVGRTGFSALSVGKNGEVTWKAPDVKIPMSLDEKKTTEALGAFKNRMERQQYIATMKLNTQKADQGLDKFVGKVEKANPTLTIKVATKYLGTPLGNQIIGGTFGKIGKSGGMNETLTRDTIIYAHRNENVRISSPSRTIQDSGGGGKPINVKVFIGNEEFKGYIHTTVNEDQGNTK